MDKIASPVELASELRRLLATVSGAENPSRGATASALRALAARITPETGARQAADSDDDLTYKGKALRLVGPDTWVLEGQGCQILCDNKGGRGWKAKLSVEGERTLAGEMYGRELEGVIHSILHNEFARIKGAHSHLDDLEKKLKSLGGE